MGRHIPKYAILSHTWEEEEVSFKDMSDPSRNNKKGYRKIEMTCQVASQAGLSYAWIDTCCIDKSSSAELTEAINSMYRWYKRSDICYAFLMDLPASESLDTALKKMPVVYTWMDAAGTYRSRGHLLFRSRLE